MFLLLFLLLFHQGEGHSEQQMTAAVHQDAGYISSPHGNGVEQKMRESSLDVE
jgi:hypothetical protein